MDKVTSLFGPDPLSTEVGQLVDRATSAVLESEDWGLNMEICDVINQREDGAKDAVKAIKKKLQQNAGKNSHVVELTLTVAETCVKNCGPRLHTHIATREFLDELVKVLSPKNNPPQAVQERVLLLIQSWADAFRGKHELREVERVYQELRAKGVDFPAADLDRMAPIFTPARSVNAPPPPQPQPPAQQLQPSRTHSSSLTNNRSPIAVAAVAAAAAAPPPATMPGTMSAPQRAKLLRDLDAIKANCAVLSDMIVTLKPGEEPTDELQLMVELEATCREMQHRLLDLIGSGQVLDEMLVSDMLKLNDDLNGVFLRYERHTRARNQVRGVVSGGTPVRSPGQVPPQRMTSGPSAAFSSSILQPPPPITQPVAQKAAASNNLIDFGGEGPAEPVATQAQEESKPIDEREQLASLFATSASPSTSPYPPPTQMSSGPFTSPYRSTLPPLTVASYDSAAVPSSSAGLSAAVNAKAAGIDLDQLEANLSDVEQWLKQRPATGSPGQTAAPAPAPPPRAFERPADDPNSPFGL